MKVLFGRIEQKIDEWIRGSTMLRIIVDFNSIFDDPDPRQRVSINTIYRPEYLDQLKSGLTATFYDCESLEVDGIVEFDETHQMWCGVLDWSTQRDVPPAPECK